VAREASPRCNIAFALATAFVDIGARTTNFDKAVSGVKKSVAGLRSSFSALSGYSLAVWGALAGAGGYAAVAVKNFMDAERADERLRAALRATGQEVEGNATRLDKFAQHLQSITVYEDDAVKGLMAYATNLGVTADQMEDVVKLGVGLGEALFGGDASAGIEAAAKAQQGNFRELERLIPKMKQAQSAQEKLALAVAAGNSGFKQAQERTATLEGKLKQLWVALGNTSEGFGKILAGSIDKAVKAMMYINNIVDHLDDGTKKQIVSWAGYAAAIAGVVVFGPKVISFASTVIGTFTTLASALVSVSVAMVSAMLTGPGLILAGFSALVIGFAVLAEGGIKSTGAIMDAFKGVWEFLTLVFSSSKTVGEAWSSIMAGLGFEILNGWIIVKSAMIDLWLGIKNAVLSIWDGVVDNLILSVAKGMQLAGQFFLASFTSSIKLAIDLATSALVGFYQMVNQIPGIQKILPGIDQMPGLFQAAGNAAAAAVDAGASSMNKLITDGGNAFIAQAEKDKKIRQQTRADQYNADRTANDKSQADATKANAQNRKSFEEDLKKRQAALGDESLTAKIKALWDQLKNATGIDQILALVDKIKAAANGAEGKANLQLKNANEKTAKSKSQSLEEAFKQNLFGGFVGSQEIKNRQAAEDAARGQEENTIATKQNTEAVAQLNKAISNGIPAVFSA
jgi:hypothetical protein